MKNTTRKGDITRNEPFLLSLVVFSFYRINNFSSILDTSEIVVCKLCQFETVRNLSHDNSYVFVCQGPDRTYELLN